MKFISNNWKVVFTVVCLIIILPLIFYWVNFGSATLSSDFKSWVDFSNFWSPFLVTALTIILAYISWQSLEIVKLKEKPIVIVEKRSKKEGGKEFLTIRNVGNGPALEIKLFIGVKKDELIDFNTFLINHGISGYLEDIHIRCSFHYLVPEFGLSNSELVYIDWQDNIEKIAVVYTDIYGTTKTVTWNQQETRFYDQDLFGIDMNGFKKKENIYQKNKSGDRDYKQVFSLPEVGEKKENSWVLT
ncbi:hypothetical protein [Cecembia rubra]|uniref:Uncharacterized protein n=1 Tax=Cecembia rubra TaxID=1485585 RepID=A0A2P8DYI6_9BACT|nr:hypothetical protein [Cecembia rubra]PSL02237.1 hypothetical protein CLV48_11019 [Cecembia rubra]